MPLIMSSTDNSENFVDLFECVAVAWGWLKNKLALCLLPLLYVEVQCAALHLEYQGILKYCKS